MSWATDWGFIAFRVTVPAFAVTEVFVNENPELEIGMSIV
jgi:hypothetical protein